MTLNFFDKYSSITIGTGNILENEEFKKAKNPTQEVSVAYTLSHAIKGLIIF